MMLLPELVEEPTVYIQLRFGFSCHGVGVILSISIIYRAHSRTMVVR